ncbi:hypothetical protein D3Z47_02175 [Lachnospiraceae bacterium]|nr:hypothetical protein [Lachnospiraceae bacterium]
MFADWQNKYLFEILLKLRTALIWQGYNIATMLRLLDCNETQFKEICSVFPELSETIKTLLPSIQS